MHSALEAPGSARSPVGSALPPGRSSLTAGRVVAGALGAAALVYALFVGTGPGRELDAAIVALELDGPDRRLAVLGGLATNALTVVVATAWLSLVAWRRHGLAEGLACAAVAGGAVLAATVLKAVLPEVDPAGGEAARELGAGFFPSGHTAAATALCLAAMIAAPSRRSALVPAIAALAATALACPHLLTAWHHASDVPGAMLVTTAWAALVLGRIRERPRAAAPRPRLSWARAAAVLVGLAACIALLELARRSGVPLGPLHPLLALTAVGVGGTALVCTYAIAHLLAAPPRALRRAPRQAT